jgi:hypothetical protein
MSLRKIGEASRVAWAGKMAVVAGFILAMAAMPTGAAVWQRLYTDNGDFDEGVLDGVNHTEVADQLQLNKIPTTFPFAWIANSGEGTVSKIDTATGIEVARYRTGPNGGSDSPSRTAVDFDGNCWVANRAFGGQGSVVKILLSGGIDRNHNGVIDTSTGPGDVKAWWQDERVVLAVNVGSWNDVPRSLAIDGDGNVWVGLYYASKYVVLNGYTGNWIADVPVGGNPYGAAIDAHGILWSATLQWGIDKVDIATRTYLKSYYLGGAYGIAVDGSGFVWVGGYGSWADLFKFDPATETAQAFNAPGSNGRGVCVDSVGNIWVALGYGSPNNLVAKFRSDGSLVGTYQVGWNPCGVGTDADGNIIVVCQDSWQVYKLDQTTGAPLWVTPVGNTPYTYSDFTGYTIRNITQKTGTWTVVFDSGVPANAWGKASWTSNEPEDTSVAVQVRAADAIADLDLQPWLDVSNGIDFGGVSGQYIQIKARLTTTTEESPILYDLTIEAANQRPDCSGARADPMILWPPNHQMVPVNILGVTDPDGDPVTITTTGITSDEPTASDPGSGGARHAPDATGVGTATANVRAERSGTGNGRVYEISFEASDGMGGVCNGIVRVCVPHDMGNGNDAVDDGQKYDATRPN